MISSLVDPPTVEVRNVTLKVMRYRFPESVTLVTTNRTVVNRFIMRFCLGSRVRLLLTRVYADVSPRT